MVPSFEPSDIEQVVDQRTKATHAVIHRAQRLALRRVQGSQLLIDQQLHVADDGRHRRGEFVGDVAVESRSSAFGLTKPAVGLRQLFDLGLQARDDALTLGTQVSVRFVRRQRSPCLLGETCGGWRRKCER